MLSENFMSKRKTKNGIYGTTNNGRHEGHEELKELNLPEENIVYCSKPIERLKKDTALNF